MTETPFGKQEKISTDQFLKGYTLYKRMLGIEKYQCEYSPEEDSFFNEIDKDMLKEAPIARVKMFEVRHFILGLENSNEKLLLYYHYVKGESVERCAELLGMSRRSAFRLKNRALEVAHAALVSQIGQNA